MAMRATTTTTAALLAALWIAAPAAAEYTAWGEEKPRWVEADAELINLGVLLSDSDFDRTPPAYNEERQHVGVVGTVFRPGVTFHVLPTLRIRYQAELGLNVWSRNDADQLDPTAEDLFLLLHRQVYAEGELPSGRLGFKAGYDRWRDPTSLTLAHFTGAAHVHLAGEGGVLGLDVGMLPDATYEGWEILENNFTHDTFFAHLGATLPRPDGTFFAQPGALVLIDGSEVGRRLIVTSPYLSLGWIRERIALRIDLAGQLGTQFYASNDATNESQAAWAAQVHGEWTPGAPVLTWNVLALSPDDATEGNGVNGAFRYSGFSRSPTLWLSENELFDLWNNLDERMGTRRGSQFLMRTGLLQADVRFGYRAGPVFEPAIVVGAATALNPANALGRAFVALEVDGDFVFRHRDVLEAHLIATLLVPGGAAAAALNEIDRTRTDPQFGGMATLAVRF